MLTPHSGTPFTGPFSVMPWYSHCFKLPPCVLLLFKKIKYVVTSVGEGDGEIDMFPITVGPHRGPPFSQYIFQSVRDEIMNDIQGYVHKCILFAHDVVIVDKIRVGVTWKLQ